jgi:uncharacterized protein (TIGR02186 family)
MTRATRLDAPSILPLLALVCLLTLGAATARAQSLVADLSSHLVPITTGFNGAELMLFGSIDNTDGGGDVVVIITGPTETVTLRRKRRIAGIWMNAESMVFEDVPNFYAVAATRPLAEIASPDVLKRQQIGALNLDMRPAEQFKTVGKRPIEEFREALVRNKQAIDLYAPEVGAVTLIADRLFRTEIRFPANMTTGWYTAVVYLFKDGEPIHAQTTPLRVEKTGFGAEVFDFAHQRSAAYGALAIIIAVAAGWLASAIFRKV